MVLEAYMDESFDDGGVFVLSGYITSAERWASFTSKWDEALPLVVNPRGKRRFKMREIAASPERMVHLPVFHSIIRHHVEMSVSVIIDQRDIDAVLSRVSISDEYAGELSGFSDPYYFAFRLLADAFHNARLNRPDLVPLEDVVDFYFDDQSRKGAILRGWDRYIASKSPAERAMYGATPKFENDEQFLPLQAADFHAWWLRKWAAEYGPWEVYRGHFPFDDTDEPELHSLVFVMDRDKMLEFVVEELLATLPADARDRDLGPIAERVDPPSPVERASSAFVRWARKAFGR